MNKIDVDRSSLFYDHYQIYLSDGAVKDLQGVVGIGGGVAAILGALSHYVSIEASTPPGVGALIAGVIAVEVGAITIQNDGCGVVLNYYFVRDPYPGTPPAHWVGSQ